MKKEIAIALILIIASSCTKNPLIGVWTQDQKTVYLYDGQLLALKNFCFNDDGSGARWVSFPTEKDLTPGPLDPFNWYSENNELYIYDKYGNYKVKYTILDNQLIIYYNDDENEIFNRNDNVNLDSLKDSNMHKSK